MCSWSKSSNLLENLLENRSFFYFGMVTLLADINTHRWYEGQGALLKSENVTRSQK